MKLTIVIRFLLFGLYFLLVMLSFVLSRKYFLFIWAVYVFV